MFVFWNKTDDFFSPTHDINLKEKCSIFRTFFIFLSVSIVNKKKETHKKKLLLKIQQHIEC